PIQVIEDLLPQLVATAANPGLGLDRGIMRIVVMAASAIEDGYRFMLDLRHRAGNQALNGFNGGIGPLAVSAGLEPDESRRRCGMTPNTSAAAAIHRDIGRDDAVNRPDHCRELLVKRLFVLLLLERRCVPDA